jgi:hypothetical protein
MSPQGSLGSGTGARGERYILGGEDDALVLAAISHLVGRRPPRIACHMVLCRLP